MRGINPINILYALQEFALFACNKLKQIFLFFAWISAPDTFRTYTAGMNECQTLSSPCQAHVIMPHMVVWWGQVLFFACLKNLIQTL